MNQQEAKITQKLLDAVENAETQEAHEQAVKNYGRWSTVMWTRSMITPLPPATEVKTGDLNFARPRNFA